MCLLPKQDFTKARAYYTESTGAFEALAGSPTAGVLERSNLGLGYTKLGELERTRRCRSGAELVQEGPGAGRSKTPRAGG